MRPRPCHSCRVRGGRLLLMLALMALCCIVAGAPASALSGSPPAKHPKRHAKSPKHKDPRQPPRHAPAVPGVRSVPVTFTVVNDNETQVSCLQNNPDGKTY